MYLWKMTFCNNKAEFDFPEDFPEQEKNAFLVLAKADSTNLSPKKLSEKSMIATISELAETLEFNSPIDYISIERGVYLVASIYKGGMFECKLEHNKFELQTYRDRDITEKQFTALLNFWKRFDRMI